MEEAQGIAAILTSPPYADIAQPFHGNKPEHVIEAWFQKYRAAGGGMGYEKFRESVRSGRRVGMADYGTTPGQIGALPAGDADAILTSPPYAKGGQGGGPDSHPERCERSGVSISLRDGYGTTPGQVGALPEGDADAILTSPPYAETNVGNGDPEAELKRLQAKLADGTLGRENARMAKKGQLCPHGNAALGDYGQTAGQIGGLPAGNVEAVLTSPPWAAQMHDGGNTPTAQGRGRNGREQRPCEAKGEHNPTRDYGDTEGQIGKEAGETYWSACKQIYLECLKCLHPGGIVCVVCKDFVRAGARVPLCDQTLALLCSLGFIPVERIRAWLVTETREPCLWGGEVVKRKSRASFFRRLYDKKHPGNEIDFEEVLVVRKGGDA